MILFVEFLSNPECYEKIQEDPLASSCNRINNKLVKLQNNKNISKKLFSKKLKVPFAELTYEDLNDCEKTLYINLMNNSDNNYNIPIEEYELEYCNDSNYSLIIDEKYD